MEDEEFQKLKQTISEGYNIPATDARLLLQKIADLAHRLEKVTNYADDECNAKTEARLERRKLIDMLRNVPQEPGLSPDGDPEATNEEYLKWPKLFWEWFNESRRLLASMNECGCPANSVCSWCPVEKTNE